MSFEQYCADRAARAAREIVARQIETGAVRLIGSDPSGRPLVLGSAMKRNQIEAAHAARNRAAVDSWTFAQFAQAQAAEDPTPARRRIAARALLVARAAATVCMP